jgi:hypothetical protein
MGLGLGASPGEDPCGRPAVFRRAPSAPPRSVRVSHDSDPTSRHEPCPKPNPNPNPNPKAFRDIRTIEPAPTGGPAWPQQRKTSDRVGHPVKRYGQRALFNLAPKPKPNGSSTANLCEPLPTPIPTSRSRNPAAPFLSIPAPFTKQDWQVLARLSRGPERSVLPVRRAR